MTEQQLITLRRQLRGGEQPPDWVVAELRRVADALVRYGRLPASMSPYGSWDEEATEELMQGWMEGKLLRGDLRALADRARTPVAFRRLAERSLRHWLLNQRERSQAQNLFGRMARLLEQDQTTFKVTQAAERKQDTWWTLANKPEAEPFAGPDRELLSAAWSLGEFVLVRFSSEQTKLSPLLSGPDLRRFVVGMLDATGRALTLNLLQRALRDRFDLGDVQLGDLEAAGELASPEGVAEDAVLREAAGAVIGELDARQTAVLLGLQSEQTSAALAAELNCSPATITNDKAAIAKLVARYSENDSERDQLLKKVADVLYEEGA